jgi:hypothetical protein
VATPLTRPQADRGQAGIAPYIQGRFDRQRRQGIESASAIRAVGARLGLRSSAQAEGDGVGSVHQISRPNGGIMSSAPTNVGVFFGQVSIGERRVGTGPMCVARSSREQSEARSRQSSSR